MAFKLPQSLDQTTNSLVKTIYGGDDPQNVAIAKDVIQKAFQRGYISPNAKKQLQQFMGGGDTSYIEGQINNAIKNEVAYNKDPQGFLNGKLSGIKGDNSNLTDSDLQDKLAILQAIGGQSQRKKIGSVDTLDSGLVTHHGNVGDSTQETGGGTVLDHSDIFKGDQPNIDTSADVKAIQDILNSRQQSAQNETDVNNYIKNLPDELSRNREQFLSDQTKSAVDQYENQYVPDALQNVNARSKYALFGGDVPDALSSGAAQTAAELQAARAQLEQEDNQFYFNAAYSNQVRQVLNTNQNTQDYLTNERNNVLTGQQQKFQSVQNDLNNSLNTRLTQADYNRQQTVQQANLKRQQDLINKQRTQGLYNNFGQALGTATTVAGIATANPALIAGGTAINGGNQILQNSGTIG